MRFTLLALLCTALPLVAEDKERPDKERRSHEFAEKIFARLDKDQSGSISLTEFRANPRLERATEEQIKQLFARLDKDRNRVLTPEELRRPPRRHQKWQDKGPVDFAAFSEQPRVREMPEEDRRQLFQRLDRNGDGLISREDFPKRRRGEDDHAPVSIAPYDIDRDGKISFDEFRKIPHHRRLNEDEAEDRFERLDRNDDGYLTPDEGPEPGGPEEKKGRRGQQRPERPE
ncbi:MAG: EF-hand domain-containing protein [Verrucomicrobiota bacterium JB023]|nr:EF-hand domain-containing protein [Verrucomicrobiota bacterium JB023]